MVELLGSFAMGSHWGEDMSFLAKVVWPIAETSVMQHDSFSCEQFGGGRAFPSARIDGAYVGSVFLNGGGGQSGRPEALTEPEPPACTVHADRELALVWRPPAKNYCYQRGGDWSLCAGDHLLHAPSSKAELLARDIMCLYEPLCWKQLDWLHSDPPADWTCKHQQATRVYDMSYQDGVMADHSSFIEGSLSRASNTQHEAFLCNCKGGEPAISNYPSYQFKTVENFACLNGTECNLILNKSLVVAPAHRVNMHRCSAAASRRNFENVRRLAMSGQGGRLAGGPRHIIGPSTIYDVEYIRHYTGVRPIYLGSSFFDVLAGAEWTGERPEILWNAHLEPEDFPALIRAAKITKAPWSGKPFQFVPPSHEGRYETRELTAYKAVVVFPYSVTNMKVVEQYAMALPMFVPDINFMQTAWMFNDRTASRKQYCPKLQDGMLKAHIGSPYEFGPNFDSSVGKEAADAKFWLGFAEIYQWPCVQQFSSWEGLVELLQTADFAEMSACMKQANKWRRFEQMSNWCWVMGQIERGRDESSSSYEQALRELYNSTDLLTVADQG